MKIKLNSTQVVVEVEVRVGLGNLVLSIKSLLVLPALYLFLLENKEDTFLFPMPILTELGQIKYIENL